jgi:hypothetical protein
MKQVLGVVVICVTLISCDLHSRIELDSDSLSLREWAERGIWLRYTIPFPLTEK